MDSLLLIHSDSEHEARLKSALTAAGPDVAISVAKDPETVQQCPLPKMIVLDLDHPSPFTILKWLRSDPNYQHIPVIVVTSSPEAQRVNQAYELGANTCVIKSEGSIATEVARGIGTYLKVLKSAAA